MPENHQYRLKPRPPGENPSNEPPTTVMSTPGEISGLGTGLAAVSAKLSDSQAEEAIEPFLAAIKGTTDPNALQALGVGLADVTAKLGHGSARAVDGVVIGVLNRARDEAVFAIYAELEAKLMGDKSSDQQIVGIFRLLRNPLSAGKTTEKLLAFLKQIPDVNAEFDGDLWKAVKWVQIEQKEGRLKNLDLDAPLRAPELHS